MSRCEITLLGNMQVTLDGKPLPVPVSTRARLLLAYLAVESGQVHERERLAGLFWPNMPEVQARQDLSQALYNLRQALGEAGPGAPIILVTSKTVQFNPFSDHSLDVKEFDNRIAAVQQHNHPPRETCEQCARLLQQAEQLYQDDFLSGSALRGCQDYEEWVLFWREKLRHQLCEALSSLADFYEGRGELSLGLKAAERWARLDLYSESAQRKLMRLLALDGQRAQALARYQSYHKQLLDELGVEPDHETRQLYARILDEETAQANQPGSAGLPGALPVPLTPFIGRHKELADLAAWLRNPQTRLVTLLGPGGCGKTRLALQVAHSLRYNYPDGIFFVSLSGLISPEAFLPALAHALGVVVQANWGDPFEQLLGYLQRRRLLLLLDSFEEAHTAASQVTRILQAAPGVQVLVTSRARLNLQSEQVFPLQGMPYPDPASLQPVIASEAVSEATQSPHAGIQLEDYSALQLFYSAARQVRPDYVPAAGDLPHLARICQLVDGMPLGLVLAAGWLGTCSPQEIAEEIERSIDFLSAAWSDVPTRQRSLRATLDYSWRLLDEAERRAFQRLSVFQRRFTRTAAEQVAGADAAVLRSLVDKSMLLTTQSYYRMHDLVRQYASEKLAAAETEASQVRDAHNQYFLGRLTERTPLLKSAQRSATLGEIDAEMHDIQAAWNWACAQVDISLLAGSLEGLCLYYEMRVRFREAEQACQKGLTVQPASADLQKETSLLRTRLLVWQANFTVLLGQLDAAQKLRQQAGELLDQFETQGLAQSEAKGLAQSKAQELAQSEAKGVDVRHPRAMLWQLEGDAQIDLKVKFDYYERSIQIYRELDDDWRLAGVLHLASISVNRSGDITLCLQYRQEALRLARQVGEPNLILSILNDLTLSYFFLNQPETAYRLMHEAEDFAKSIDELPSRSNAQLQYGIALTWSGRFPEAISVLERVLPTLRSLGYRWGMVICYAFLGYSHVLVGEYDSANSLLKANLPEAEQGGFPRETASTLVGLGIVALALGHSSEAVEYFQESTRRYRDMNFAGELGWALGGLALALEANAQPEAAREALVEALHLAEITQSMATMWTCLPAMITLLKQGVQNEVALRVHRVAIRQAMHQNSRWYAHLIGDTMNAEWEKLNEAQRLEIDAYASQHTPFSILPEVLALLG